MWKLPQLRATATMTRATTAANSEIATTATRPSAGQWPVEIDCTVRWEQGAPSAGTGLDSPRFRSDSIAFCLQLLCPRENGYIRRRPNDAQTTAVQRTTAVAMRDTDQRPRDARSTIRWRRCATSAGTELDSSQVRFEIGTFDLRLFYTRENGYSRRHPSYIQATAIRGTTTIYEETQQTEGSKLATATATGATTTQATTTTTRLDADRQLCEATMAIRWRQSATDADTELDSSRFQFGFRTLYLNLCYSRADRYLRRSVIAARESMTYYERKTREHTAERVPRLPLEPRPRPSRIREHAQHARDMGITRSELNSSTFHFYFRMLYLHLGLYRENSYLRRDVTGVPAIAI
ncbi:hypothetical protein F5J12DRAFT_77022 [Pisolithus orientalis]|uniref:uncharacterized protein n=1 Tax=Pisolithus orientalis TaxID=936130 RepID=UPI002224CE52|nr:uncharacterized protein F5J12DRAFT_77022 [Pisolithus orientalis]KAI5984573.1 hypothetical protein F5J12DRAFT_77022 [Pisolithus orientalis]